MTQDPTDMPPKELSAFHGAIYNLWQNIQGLPYAMRQALGLQVESQSSEVVGDLIQNAYNALNAAIQAAMQRDDVNTATQVAALKALKATVPYHYSLGNKDENWLNEQINTIIGEPNVSNTSQANAIGNAVPSPPKSWEDTTSQENTASGAKAPQSEA